MRVLRARGNRVGGPGPVRRTARAAAPGARRARGGSAEPQARRAGGRARAAAGGGRRPLRGRRRDPQPARRVRGGRAGCRASSTTPTGSTDRAPTRCCSRMRRLMADPIAFVVAVREGEPSFARRREPAHAARSAASIAMPPPPCVGEEAVDRLYAATAGNPLALLELAPEAARLTDLPIDAPLPIAGSVARGFLRRARSAAGADAARTRGRGRERLAASCRRSSARTRAWPASSSRPKQSASSPCATARFSSATSLARSAVYGAAAPEDRRSAHRALARALPDHDADRRAWHLALATVGPDETAASALAQAGDRAYARSAYAVAGAAYERAATLSARSRPAALPGRGRDVARRPGRAGDLVPRRSAARRRRT